MAITAAQLTQILDQHWGPLLVWVGRANGIAEDVVQQAFVALSAQEQTPSNPVAWLYATARNIGINERRKLQTQKARHRVVAKPEVQSSETWQCQQAAELAEQLETLPDDLRETVVAHLWGEMTFAEIATATGCSQTTVWRQYQRALQSLKESLVSNER